MRAVQNGAGAGGAPDVRPCLAPLRRPCGLRPTPRETGPARGACDYNRISGFTHLRSSAPPTPSGVLKPPILLCEAFGRRDSDLENASRGPGSLLGRV